MRFQSALGSKVFSALGTFPPFGSRMTFPMTFRLIIIIIIIMFSIWRARRGSVPVRERSREAVRFRRSDAVSSAFCRGVRTPPLRRPHSDLPLHFSEGGGATATRRRHQTPLPGGGRGSSTSKRSRSSSLIAHAARTPDRHRPGERAGTGVACQGSSIRSAASGMGRKTSTREHPCQVQYRQLVRQERQRIRRASASRSQADDDDDDDAHTGIFCSGFLSVINSRCEETPSATLPTFDDDDDDEDEGVVSEKEDSGELAEDRSQSETPDEARPEERSGESAPERMSEELPVTDNSISCDSLLETEDRDTETAAARGPDRPEPAGRRPGAGDPDDDDDDPAEAFERAAVSRAWRRFRVTRAKDCFCSGFLSLLGSGRDQSSSLPSSRDDRDEEGHFGSGFLSVMVDGGARDVRPRELSSQRRASESRPPRDRQDRDEDACRRDDSGRGPDSRAQRDRRGEPPIADVDVPSEVADSGGSVWTESPEETGMADGRDPSGNDGKAEEGEAPAVQDADSSGEVLDSDICASSEGRLEMDAKEEEEEEEDDNQTEASKSSQDDPSPREARGPVRGQAQEKSSELEPRDVGGDGTAGPALPGKVGLRDPKTEWTRRPQANCCRCRLLTNDRNAEAAVSRGQLRLKRSGEDGKPVGHPPDVGTPRTETLKDQAELLPSLSDVSTPASAGDCHRLGRAEDATATGQILAKSHPHPKWSLVCGLSLLLSGEFLDSDSFVEMDFARKEETTKATKSPERSRGESSGRDARGRPAGEAQERVRRDPSSDSGVRRRREERDPGTTSGDTILSLDKSRPSPKQWFAHCSACVRPDSKREGPTKSSKSAATLSRSGAKPDDKPSKSSTFLPVLVPWDSAVAIGDGDLAGEIAELEAQSDGRLLESSPQEVSERVLDSSDSETSSKSRDESGSDSSVEDVDGDFAARRCERIWRRQTDGKRQELKKEELSKPRQVTKEPPLRLGQEKEEEKQEEPKSKERTQKRRPPSKEELAREEAEEAERLRREKEKRILLYQQKLQREEEEEARRLVREKEKRIQLCQEALRKKEKEELEELELLERERETKTRPCTRAFRPKEGKEASAISCQEELMQEEEEEEGPADQLQREKALRMRRHREQLSKEEAQEMERLRIQKETRICGQKEAIRRDEEKEAMQLTREKETRIRLRREALRRKEAAAPQPPERESKARTQPGEEKRGLGFEGAKSGKECLEEPMWKEVEEEEQPKRTKEPQIRPGREPSAKEGEEDGEPAGKAPGMRIWRQKEELLREEKEELARLKTEKETRICRRKVELRREEEDEAEQLKRAKETRLRLRREELRKAEEEEEELLRRETALRKRLLREELDRARKEAERSVGEKQRRMRACLEELTREEEDEAEQLGREKAARVCQRKKQLMREEEEEVAKLREEMEGRIARSLQELSREEKEEAEQLKRDKERRMQGHLEELQREEEQEEAQILKRQKEDRFHPGREQHAAEKEKEDNELKKYLDDEADKMKRERPAARRSRDRERPKRPQEGQEQMDRETRTRLNLEEPTTGDEEEGRRLARGKDSLSRDEPSGEAEEVAWLRRGKEMRIRLYLEGLRREEDDQIESLKRERMERMCLHQEALRREEENEVEQLQRDRQARMRLCQEELRREEVNHLETLRREKAKRTPAPLSGPREDGEQERLKRKKEKMRKKLHKLLKAEMQLRLAELMREEEAAEQLQNRKGRSTEDAPEGQLPRGTEAPPMFREDQLRSEDEELACLKMEMTISLCHKEARTDEDGPENSRRKPSKVRPRQQEFGTDKEADGLLGGGIEAREMLHEDQTRREAEDPGGLNRERIRKPLCLDQLREADRGEESKGRETKPGIPQKERKTEEEEEEKRLFAREMETQTILHEPELSSEDNKLKRDKVRIAPRPEEPTEQEGAEKWKGKQTKSWLRQKGSSTEEGVEGQFMREMETQTTLLKDDPRSEDDKAKTIRTLRDQREPRREEEPEKLKGKETKSWLRQQERRTDNDAKGPLGREIETQTMLHGGRRRTEDEEAESSREMRTPHRQEKPRREEDEREKLKRTETKSCFRQKESRTEERNGQFMREMETQTTLLKDDPRSEDDKPKTSRTLLDQKEPRREEEPEKWKGKETKSWLRQQESSAKEVDGQFMRGIETQTMLPKDDPRSEDDKPMPIRTLRDQKEPRGEEEPEKWKGKETKSWLRQQESSAKEVDGQFMREIETQTMLPKDDPRSEDDKPKTIRTLRDQKEPRGEEEPEKWKGKETKSWLRQQESSAKEVDGQFMREIETQTMLLKDDPRSEDDKAMPIRTLRDQKEPREVEEPEKWKGKETKSWLRQQESSAKEVDGQFMREIETQTMLPKDDPRSEDDKAMPIRTLRDQKEPREVEEPEKWKGKETKSWLRQQESSAKEVDGQFMREIETQTMLPKDDPRSEDDKAMPIRTLRDQKEPREVEEPEKWKGKETKSWLRQQESSAKEVDGQFMREIETQTMLPKDDPRSEDDKAMPIRTLRDQKEPREVEEPEKWKGKETKSWLRQQESSAKEVDGQFMREIETQTMLLKMTREAKTTSPRRSERCGTRRSREKLRSRRNGREGDKIVATPAGVQRKRSGRAVYEGNRDPNDAPQMTREAKTTSHADPNVAGPEGAGEVEEPEKWKGKETKSWLRQQESSAKEVDGQFMRGIETQTMLPKDEPRSEDDKAKSLKAETIRTLRDQKEPREEKLEKWKGRECQTEEDRQELFMREPETREMTTLYREKDPRREEDRAEELKRSETKPCLPQKEEDSRVFIRDIETQTMLQEGETSREDDKLKREKTRMAFLQEGPREDDEAGEWKGKETKSWLREKECTAKEEVDGQFMRELETQAMFHEDQPRNVDQESRHSELEAVRMSPRQAGRRSEDEPLKRDKLNVPPQLELRRKPEEKEVRATLQLKEPRREDHETDWLKKERETILGLNKQVLCAEEEEDSFKREKEKGVYLWQEELSAKEDDKQNSWALWRDREEEDEEVESFKRQKQRRIGLCVEELKRQEEEEVEQLQREKETRMRNYVEELRREEENQADRLKREKEQRIRLLQEEIKGEEEEEAQRLKRDQRERMNLLQKEMKKEEETERLKWEQERRTRLRREEQRKHEEEETSRSGRPEERLDTGTQLRREERAEFGKEEDQTDDHLRDHSAAEEEQRFDREKVKRTPSCQRTPREEEEDEELEHIKSGRKKRMHRSREGSAPDQDDGEERFKVTRQNPMSRLQDELKRETEELIDKLKAQKRRRTRLRQIDLWGEEQERKLKLEYKERLRALRHSLLLKRRDEELLLDNMFEQKKKLRERVHADQDQEQRQIRQDREAALRALYLALEEEREAERDRLQAQKRQFFNRLSEESEDEMDTLRMRLQDPEPRGENRRFLKPQQAPEKSLNSGFCGTYLAPSGAAAGSQHGIFGTFVPMPQRTDRFPAYAVNAGPPRPVYVATHPLSGTPQPLLCQPRATAPVDPFATTYLSETYLANPPAGYCDQLGLNNFDEITVYRFQRQNAQWMPSVHT
ncbi:trichohyalin-like [Syngnathoides biaculeatus]|uniref:trichohyalin-like n=1 Tax=Syngnathoides biaculeatus TaxID=300417 RepID=UPI002ADD8A81|nr:trichohyalin-like [Syngnathoides biaculeatus]